MGNVTKGIPLDEQGNFTGTFLSLLNPYSVLLGPTTVALFSMHGGIYLLMKTHAHINRLILSQAAAIGLSPGQPKILECLLLNGECNQKAIAENCEIEQATVGSILSRMERDGLVCRSQRDGNRRSLYVSLTPQGRDLAQQMEQIFHQADAQASAQLTPQELRQLTAMLKTVCASLAPTGKGEV